MGGEQKPAHDCIMYCIMEGYLSMGKVMTVKFPRKCAECGNEFFSPRPRRTCSDVCRFWATVDKSAGPSACWPWRGHICEKTGYGDIPGRYACGKRTSAHRRAWALANRCDPDRLCVLHKCDNRVCANPAHLFLGTHRTNLWDSWKKGRAVVCAPGEDHPRAKLTEAIVRQIRTGGEDAALLAEQYGVSVGTIRNARRGVTWRHINPMTETLK